MTETDPSLRGGEPPDILVQVKRLVDGINPAESSAGQGEEALGPMLREDFLGSRKRTISRPIVSGSIDKMPTEPSYRGDEGNLSGLDASSFADDLL